jgi:hypothetical protein
MYDPKKKNRTLGSFMLGLSLDQKTVRMGDGICAAEAVSGVRTAEPVASLAARPSSPNSHPPHAGTTQALVRRLSSSAAANTTTG